MVRELLASDLEHAAHLDHALHLIAQLLAARILAGDRAADLPAHGIELALHGLDPGLGAAQLVLQVAHHLLMELLGHLEGGHHRAQAVLAVARLRGGALGRAALLLVLLLELVALGGDGAGLGELGAGLGELLAQGRDILRRVHQLAQPGDHADEDILGEVGEGAGVGAGELGAEARHLAQQGGVGAADDVRFRCQSMDLGCQGAQLRHRLLAALVLLGTRLLGRREQPVRLRDIAMVGVLELGVGLLQGVDVLLGVVHLVAG